MNLPTPPMHHWRNFQAEPADSAADLGNQPIGSEEMEPIFAQNTKSLESETWNQFAVEI